MSPGAETENICFRWLDYKAQVEDVVRPYFFMRDELSVQSSVIFWEEREMSFQAP